MPLLQQELLLLQGFCLLAAGSVHMVICVCALLCWLLLTQQVMQGYCCTAVVLAVCSPAGSGYMSTAVRFVDFASLLVFMRKGGRGEA